MAELPDSGIRHVPVSVDGGVRWVPAEAPPVADDQDLRAHGVEVPDAVDDWSEETDRG